MRVLLVICPPYLPNQHMNRVEKGRGANEVDLLALLEIFVSYGFVGFALWHKNEIIPPLILQNYSRRIVSRTRNCTRNSTSTNLSHVIISASRGHARLYGRRISGSILLKFPASVARWIRRTIAPRMSFGTFGTSRRFSGGNDSPDGHSR